MNTKHIVVILTMLFMVSAGLNGLFYSSNEGLKKENKELTMNNTILNIKKQVDSAIIHVYNRAICTHAYNIDSYGVIQDLEFRKSQDVFNETMLAWVLYCDDGKGNKTAVVYRYPPARKITENMTNTTTTTTNLLDEKVML